MRSFKYLYLNNFFFLIKFSDLEENKAAWKQNYILLLAWKSFGTSLLSH